MDQIPRPKIDARPTATRGRVTTNQRSGTAILRLPSLSRSPDVETATTVLGGLLAVLAFAALVAFASPVLSAYLVVTAVVAFVFAPIAVPVLFVRAVTVVLDYVDGR